MASISEQQDFEVEVNGLDMDMDMELPVTGSGRIADLYQTQMSI